MRSDRTAPTRSLIVALAAALAASLPGCGPLFQGFSILPPAEPQRLPIVVDVNERAQAAAAGDPAVIPLIQGQPGSSVDLVRIMTEDPPHLHQHSDQTIHVLEGHGLLLLDREWREVRAGMLVQIPRNVPHAFRNQAEGGTVVLSIHAPPHVVGDRVALEYDP